MVERSDDTKTPVPKSEQRHVPLAQRLDNWRVLLVALAGVISALAVLVAATTHLFGVLSPSHPSSGQTTSAAGTPGSTAASSGSGQSATSTTHGGTAVRVPAPGTPLAHYSRITLTDGHELDISNLDGKVSSAITSGCGGAISSCSDEISSGEGNIAILQAGTSGSYSACEGDTDYQAFMLSVDTGDLLCVNASNWVGLIQVTSAQENVLGETLILNVTVWQGSGNQKVVITPD
jgi:hypothetical protein